MNKKDVIVYTSCNCQKSERLKNYLANWGVDFEERNISNHRDYLNDLQEQGIFATPTAFVGETCIQGIQPERLKSELNI